MKKLRSLKFKEDMNEKASKKFFQELTPVIIPSSKSDDGELCENLF